MNTVKEDTLSRLERRKNIMNFEPNDLLRSHKLELIENVLSLKESNPNLTQKTISKFLGISQSKIYRTRRDLGMKPLTQYNIPCNKTKKKSVKDEKVVEPKLNIKKIKGKGIEPLVRERSSIAEAIVEKEEESVSPVADEGEEEEEEKKEPSSRMTEILKRNTDKYLSSLNES